MEATQHVNIKKIRRKKVSLCLHFLPYTSSCHNGISNANTNKANVYEDPTYNLVLPPCILYLPI